MTIPELVEEIMMATTEEASEILGDFVHDIRVKAQAERDQAVRERDEAWENCRYEVKRRLASETHLTQVEGERDSTREALREAWREIKALAEGLRKGGAHNEANSVYDAAEIVSEVAAKAGEKLGEESDD